MQKYWDYGVKLFICNFNWTKKILSCLLVTFVANFKLANLKQRFYIFIYLFLFILKDFIFVEWPGHGFMQTVITFKSNNKFQKQEKKKGEKMEKEVWSVCINIWHTASQWAQ